MELIFQDLVYEQSVYRIEKEIVQVLEEWLIFILGVFVFFFYFEKWEVIVINIMGFDCVLCLEMFQTFVVWF